MSIETSLWYYSQNGLLVVNRRSIATSGFIDQALDGGIGVKDANDNLVHTAFGY